MAANNKLEERIEFIVEQQAQFSVDIQLLKERLDDFQTKSNERMTRMENIMVRFYEDTSTKINALIEAQFRTDERLSETNDRLNVLIMWSSALLPTVVSLLPKRQQRNRAAGAARNDRDCLPGRRRGIHRPAQRADRRALSSR